MYYYSSLTLIRLSFLQDNAFIDRAWYEQLLMDMVKSVFSQNVSAPEGYFESDYRSRVRNNYQIMVHLFAALEGKQGKYSQSFFVARYRRLEKMEDKLAVTPFYKRKECKKIRKDIQVLDQVSVKNMLLFLRDSFVEANLGTEKQFFSLANEVAEKWFLEN